MLFVIFLIILAAGIGLWYWYNNKYPSCKRWIEVLYCVLNFAGLVGVAASVIIMAANYTGEQAKVNGKKEIYNSLTYQYENAVFDDDDDVVGRKELYNQIAEYNSDVKYYQTLQRDFWLGIYFPNVYDQLELIVYDK